MGSRDLKTVILDLVEGRGPEKTICPSEAARDVFPENWREKMDEVRDAAVELAEEGEIEILQKGECVDPHDFQGPIRLRVRE